MRYEIRPLGTWLGPVTTDRATPARFRAPWPSTLDLLGRETDLLGAQLVVLQVDVQEADLRRDGMLRANARVGFPGVRVSLDSRHGPLTYATDAYDGWKANVRAVALALEALRAVDRYGVSKSGEQYRGWSALPATAGEFGMDRNEAAALLAFGNHQYSRTQILTDPDAVRRAYRARASEHHPDHGGDVELFRRLTAARDLLLSGAGHG